MSALRSGLVNLRNMLRNSTAFQTFVDKVNHPDQADTHIYEIRLKSKPEKGDKYSRAQLEAVRPYALIHNDEDGTIERKDATGIGDCNWQRGGRIMACFVRDVPEGTTDQEQVSIDFEELIDAIVDDLKAMSDTAGYLDIYEITSRGPYRTMKEERAESGDAQFYDLTLTWGTIQS